MSNTNRNMAIVVAALLLLSVLTFLQSSGRADRFQRGQLLLPNLNPDEVVGITVVKGEEMVNLKRQGDRFLIAEKQNYPASNSSVNRLLRDLLQIGLEREVGRGKDLEEELGIEPLTEETVEVALMAVGDEEMVRLRVGKSFDDGPGNYVMRLDEEDGAVYLAASGIHLMTGISSFLDKEIVDRERSEVVRIQGIDFSLTRPAEGGDLVLGDLPAGKIPDATEVGRLESLLSGMRFDDVFESDAPEVADLVFEPTLEIDLEDGSGYVLDYVRRDDRHFLKIRGNSRVQQVAISVDESEEDLKQKAEMLTRADEIDEFNRFHGSWVYEVGEYTAEKLQLELEDFIQAETS